MAKGKGGDATTTTTSGIDPATQAYLARYRTAASNAAGAPSNPLYDEAAGLYRRAGAGMDMGLGGIDAYFNPEVDNLVGSAHTEADRQRAIGQNMAGDQAVKAKAFGGGREAVLRAQSLDDVNRGEASTVANIRSSAYTDAANRLMQDRTTNYQGGLAAAGGLGGIGASQDQSLLARLQAMLAGGNPFSTTTKTSVHTPAPPWWKTALGLGLTGVGIATGNKGVAGAGAGIVGANNG